MQRTGVGTLVVVDEKRADRRAADDARLCGSPISSKTVSDRMTPRDRLVVREGRNRRRAAEEVMRAHKIKKLPLVDAQGRLIGLVTAKDLSSRSGCPSRRATITAGFVSVPRSAPKATTSNAPRNCSRRVPTSS